MLSVLSFALVAALLAWGLPWAAGASWAQILDSLRGLRLHLARLRRLARHAPRRLADSAREHAGIARAIASADPDLAAAATEVHLRRALAHLLAEQENTPPDPTIPPLQEETA